jgi:hypothetical protein
MSNIKIQNTKRMLFSGALAGVLVGPAVTEPVRAMAASTTIPIAAAPSAATGRRPNSVTNDRQATLLRRLWGIDDVHVRSTASGALVRFSYRVVSADKAKILNSKDATPYLVDEQHGLALQVPVMEQVGQLRQVAAPRDGRDYWMAFSNKGRYLKPGNHVTLIVGNLRINGLVVE